MRKLSLIAIVVAAAALAAGCGGAQDTAESSPPDEIGAGSGSNPSVNGLGALAASNVEANTIVDGGRFELDRRLAALRGNPVVVNRWASWCSPCREELPFFNDSARAHRDQIAFIGLNTLDDLNSAEQFLSEVPFPGPSIQDGTGALAIALGIGAVSPGTAFISEAGEIVGTRPGAYASREELEADIKRYLLRG